jgi:hypothetical protein
MGANPAKKYTDEDTAAADAAAEPAEIPAAQPTGEISLADLRLSQNFLQTAGVKKLLVSVPHGRPNKQDFIRVHPDPAFRADLALIELREEREMYVLLPHIAQGMPGEFSLCTLFTVVNRQGTCFLWPVKLPKPDGKAIEWHRAAMEAATLAMKKWIRVMPNLDLGSYDLFEATGVLSEPVWPEKTFEELVLISFRDKIVNSFDHPLVKRLQGLA